MVAALPVFAIAVILLVVLTEIRNDNPAGAPGGGKLGHYLHGLRGLVQNKAVLALCLLAFLSFGLCASSVYLLNDLLDLAADRRHPRKCCRPFAAGTLPILHGAAAIPILLLAAFVLSLWINPPWFAACLASYYLLTLFYSLRLKRVLMLDAIVLAGLYTLRIIAGATVAHLSYYLARHMGCDPVILIGLLLVPVRLNAQGFRSLLETHHDQQYGAGCARNGFGDCAPALHCGPALHLKIKFRPLSRRSRRKSALNLCCPFPRARQVFGCR